MGGSHLAGDLLKTRKPELQIIIHSDYGLPVVENPKESLIIASSYSGNTEETLDAFEMAYTKNMPLAAISIGGKLMSRAKKYGVPYIQLPDTGIQPRSALGFSIMALCSMMNERELQNELSALSVQLKPDLIEDQGRSLAMRLKNRVPIIYTSSRNRAVAYNWKIKFNETGKIPAFYNVFPELNHNEMIGFDVAELTRPLSEIFYCIILKDASDDARIQKRMMVLENQYKERGMPVESFEMKGETEFYKIFSSLITADWAAFHIAKLYGVEPELVQMVEEFKGLME
jgi:glucose/mannose-6-phosphate isomerase